MRIGTFYPQITAFWMQVNAEIKLSSVTIVCYNTVHCRKGGGMGSEDIRKIAYFDSSCRPSDVWALGQDKSLSPTDVPSVQLCRSITTSVRQPAWSLGLILWYWGHMKTSMCCLSVVSVSFSVENLREIWLKVLWNRSDTLNHCCCGHAVAPDNEIWTQKPLLDQLS